VGIRKVGDLWEEGEFFLPELMQGAEIMVAAMDRLNALIVEQGGEKGTAGKAVGRVVIGTVEGDIHDIGKTLAGSMLTAHGFEVFDLGADVPVSRFIEEAEAKKADLICLSALLTTTLPAQRKVIEELEQKGTRAGFKVMVGGAPANRTWQEEIGADGYADDAISAVKVAEALMGSS
jgi:trimethylamine corrinoid protein